MASACKDFELLLSAYADGEVDARERGSVELHLSGCSDCRARLEDLRTLSKALAGHIDARVEEADFARFSDRVLQRITPERPGVLERMRVAWAEVLAYHRAAVFSSLATAAVTLLVAVPVAWKLATATATPEIVLRDLKLDDPSVQPVVMNLGDGKTLIMLVRPPGAGGDGAPVDLDKDAPTGGEL